jgi:oligopeptide transport system permease protein
VSLPLSAADTEAAMRGLVGVQGRSLWDDARRRLLRNRAAVVSIVILGAIAAAAIFAPFFLAYPYNYIDYNVVSCAPDWWPDPSVPCTAGGTHWFGTDSIGRDLLVRTLVGARVSLAVGLIATLVSLVIGVA